MQPPPAPRQIGGLYADGSYAGSPADAYYGTVQVKAVVQNGRIADVQFLQYPSDRSTSRYINGQAMPLLTQEAIRAQSAQVDGVSGATFTSQAFAESLAAALAQAKK
ncbi:MAG: FMN-binding protein [Patescibacteria group bacterium]|nr:FMN-binding protein [Patescibacteria group bacterium]